MKKNQQNQRKGPPLGAALKLFALIIWDFIIEWILHIKNKIVYKLYKWGIHAPRVKFEKDLDQVNFKGKMKKLYQSKYDIKIPEEEYILWCDEKKIRTEDYIVSYKILKENKFPFNTYYIKATLVPKGSMPINIITKTGSNLIKTMKIIEEIYYKWTKAANLYVNAWIVKEKLAKDSGGTREAGGTPKRRVVGYMDWDNPKHGWHAFGYFLQAQKEFEKLIETLDAYNMHQISEFVEKHIQYIKKAKKRVMKKLEKYDDKDLEKAIKGQWDTGVGKTVGENE